MESLNNQKIFHRRSEISGLEKRLKLISREKHSKCEKKKKKDNSRRQK